MVMAEKSSLTHLCMDWYQRSFDVLHSVYATILLIAFNHIDYGPMGRQGVMLGI